eukprot:206071-Rhodomonas_salina.1
MAMARMVMCAAAPACLCLRQPSSSSPLSRLSLTTSVHRCASERVRRAVTCVGGVACGRAATRTRWCTAGRVLSTRWPGRSPSWRGPTTPFSPPPRPTSYSFLLSFVCVVFVCA